MGLWYVMTDEYQTPDQKEDNANDLDQTLKSLPVPEAPRTDEYYSAPTWVRQEPVPAVLSVNAPATPPPSIMRESAARERARRRRVRGRKQGGEWAWVIIALTVLGVVFILGMSTLILVRSTQTEPDVLPTANFDLSNLPTAVSFRTDPNQFQSGSIITLDNGYSMMLQPWDGESRYTVLMMGIDRRPGETGLAYRTDTMIIVSLDPNTGKVGMLSIPRDLYVVMPGWNERQRINSAMVYAETNGNNGPQTAMMTVQRNLGIRIHDYLVVDFRAVMEIVDAVGGITIYNANRIYDPQYPDMNYGYDPFTLEAGEHHLDGATALKYARTRHGDNDIERARRQQEVLFAIRDRILNLDMIPQLILQAPVLMDALNANVQTSVDLNRMIELAWYLKDIPPDNINSGVMDYRYLMNYTTSSGAQVLIPNNATLGELMVQIFGPDYTQ